MKQIRAGETIIDAQISTGYECSSFESSSGFRDVFSRILGLSPTNLSSAQLLTASWLDTPLGPMIAIADENSLYLLEFVEGKKLERNIEDLRLKTKSTIISGLTQPIISIKKELHQYFDGKLKAFKTPLVYLGSPFQKRVRDSLIKIPAGETRSYSDIAIAIGNPTAFRAVANANGANKIAIVIPCHRVINSNGELGGYAGGLKRKAWLIEHEKQILKW